MPKIRLLSQAGNKALEEEEVEISGGTGKKAV